MKIEAKDLGIKYNNKFEISPSFDLSFDFEKLNSTDLLEDSYKSKDIDFEELDISYKMFLTFSAVHLRLK